MSNVAPFRLPSAPEATDLVAKYFRGLGDPSRLRILELLRGEELSVGDLVARLGLPQHQPDRRPAGGRDAGPGRVTPGRQR